MLDIWSVLTLLLYTDDYHSPEKLGTKPRRCLILRSLPPGGGWGQSDATVLCCYFWSVTELDSLCDSKICNKSSFHTPRGTNLWPLQLEIAGPTWLRLSCENVWLNRCWPEHDFNSISNELMLIEISQQILTCLKITKRTLLGRQVGKNQLGSFAVET